MSRRRRRTIASWMCGAVAAATTATALTVVPGGAAAERSSSATLRMAQQQVMLITGDRVRLDAEGEVSSWSPADGREHIPVSMRHVDGHVHVVPRDAEQLIAQGLVDRRLFDVTELSRSAYDRLAGGGVPVVVTYEEDAGPSRLLRNARPEVREELESIHGQALTLDADSATATWEALTGPRTLASGVSSITLDGVRQASLDTGVPRVGAPTARDTAHDGAGVSIAVLDTGIDETHPDLAGGKVVAAENFSAAADAEDRVGHGTHVASIIAGTGTHAGGAYAGVAPGARLLNAKVLDDEGYGLDSGIIEGMEWAVSQSADIVNLNLSLDGHDGDGPDPLEEAVNRLSASSGALFVVAAGNDGPGAADAALTVGALDDADEPAGLSAAGPRAGGGAIEPDLTAPGVAIGAAAAEDSAPIEEGELISDGHVAPDGTSMATARAAGAAALLAQAHPGWTGDQLKAALVGSTMRPEGDTSVFQQGTGRLDAAAALSQTVIAEPVSLAFGAAAWPHEDDEPLTRELTYRNLGERDVTLDLALTGVDQLGNAAPEGMFTTDADTVAVPAGGTATVEVTADTRLGGGTHGGYQLSVTATRDGGRSAPAIRTAGAVTREAEQFELAVDAIDLDGQAPTAWSAYMQNLDTGELHFITDEPDGSVRLRLPPADYVVISDMGWVSDQAPMDLTMQVYNLPDFAEDTAITLDARQAEKLDLSVFDRDAEQNTLSTGLTIRHADTGNTVLWDTARGAESTFRTQHIGPPLDGLRAVAGASWRGGSDTEYHAAYETTGAFFTGLEEHADRRELARIDLTQGALADDTRGELHFVYELFHDGPFVERPLPRTTTAYVTGGTWGYGLGAETNGEVVSLRGDYEHYRAGERRDRTINTGVFGPGFGEDDGLSRQGDELRAWIGLLTDGQGHRGGAATYDTASTTLYRDGEEYATSDQPLNRTSVRLPADVADYELTTTVSRSASALVSTEVTVALTFTSAHVAGGETHRLPASVVRFTPELALDSTAPAGARMRVPVEVQGAAAGANLGSLSVEVSRDGGETWREAPVVRGAIRVDNPPAGGSVSFRAEVSDTAGNTTTQTIMDAYRTT